MVKSVESMGLEVVRWLILSSHDDKIERVTVRCHVEVAAYLNNNKRKELAQIEEDGGMTIQILGSEGAYPEHLELDCRDDNEDVVELNV